MYDCDSPTEYNFKKTQHLVTYLLIKAIAPKYCSKALIRSIAPEHGKYVAQLIQLMKAQLMKLCCDFPKLMRKSFRGHPRMSVEKGGGGFWKLRTWVEEGEERS